LITADIKNLSIALEALNRFPSDADLKLEIHYELCKFVEELKRRRNLHEEKLRRETTDTQQEIDDEIPF